ncbi:MAG: hypothetical protein U1E27_11940, partial [Kiritimatiellia bacterium]|nr:hypothetical protein [Kiritimatiellia bacterium]
MIVPKQNSRIRSFISFGLGTLVASAVVWAIFTWPLPRYVTRGIPMSSQNVELGGARSMMPGDHLQLLYHFRLVDDFLAGRIPWFHNVYEFNTGDDRERYLPGSYFFPFSALYSGLVRILPPAAAWNLIGWLSIWVTFAASLAYAGRFSRMRAAVFFGALLSILIPFRWVNLLGGSPAGFAMMWVPLVALGVDGAVREGKIQDGLLAGTALFLLCWGDLQVFFFTTLSLPLWAGLAFLDARLHHSMRWSEIRARVPSLLFVAGGLAASAAYRMIRRAHLSASSMSTGRDLTEVRGFSPSARGFWQWAAEGLQSHVYLGITVALILAGALVFSILRIRQRTRSSDDSSPFVLPMALAALLAILVLALGVQGPFQGVALRLMRTVLPPYAMVRQTAKIFALLPTLLAVIGALSIEQFARWIGSRRWGWVAAITGSLVLLSLVEYKAQVRATICLLDLEQGAYAAVAKDSAGAENPPRALVLPLWPGEAAEASVYQFHAQSYGIRLVKGYSPVVSRRYLTEVFQPLQAINQGWLSDELIGRLDGMGVRYLLLHEDMFPEKVSPFPVTQTRDRLSGHPRLTFLAQDGAVRAYRIESRPKDPAPPIRRIPVRFPTRRIQFEQIGSVENRIPDPDCVGGAFLTLSPGHSEIQSPVWRIAPAEELHWYLRLRGQGRFVITTLWNGEPIGEVEQPIQSTDWTWVTIPLPDLPAFGPIRLHFSVPDGRVDADTGMLISGQWNDRMNPGEIREFV